MGIADQRRHVQELEKQLTQLQPMVEDLQQRLAVFDEAAALLVGVGLRDFPYEFASAVVEGDMHEACILCRRLSAACRNSSQLTCVGLYTDSRTVIQTTVKPKK